MHGRGFELKQVRSEHINWHFGMVSLGDLDIALVFCEEWCQGGTMAPSLILCVLRLFLRIKHFHVL